MTQKDYYQVLGVEKNASDDEIKKKYHKLAKKFHPDKNTDDSAEEKFKEINRAYEAIRDAESRRSYELQRRGEEMEARANNMAANPTQYTFRRPGRGFMGGFGFTADDLQDVFSRTFKERNKENTRPSDRSSFRHTFDFGRPGWDNNNETGGGPESTFTFSFGAEPQQPRRNRMGDVDDLFEDFFRDPFFMDSWPYGGGPDTGRSTRDDIPSQRSTPRAGSEDDIGSGARARAEREEVLRKAARDDEARQARAEATKKAHEAKRKEEQKKAEDERMYDWKNKSYGNKDPEEAEGTGANNYDTGMKLACNYCNSKFHPAALSAHERTCRVDYYGKMDRDASPSPPPTRRPPPRAHSFTARSTTAGGASSLKEDLLKNAYKQAARETLLNMQPPEPPPPQADFERCQWCGQSFSPTVAKYHIPFCGRKHGASKPSDAGTSRTSRTEFSAEEPTYRSTYRTPQGPRPAPSAAAAAAAAAAAGASAFDRINSPSFTNLGANLNRPRPATTTTARETDEPYTFTQPLGNRVSRASGSTTRIRYVPAASGMRTRPRVGK